jgi:APA family basic amino acid/polyamine antiporter
MLTAPRVYFAMAEDRVFFRSVAWVHPTTRVPVIAIALQGVWAIAIALTGTYAQVVNYVVAMDCIFFALTAACLFVMRRNSTGDVAFRVPGHPWTTLLFIGAEVLVVISTFAHDPVRSFIGLGIAAAGLPAYLLWAARNRRECERAETHDARTLHGVGENPLSSALQSRDQRNRERRDARVPASD